MRRILCFMLAVLMTLFTVSVASATEAIPEEDGDASTSDLSEYSSDFNWRALLRQPQDHYGEKYVLHGELAVMSGTRTSKGAYRGVLLKLDEYDGVGEYLEFEIDPLDFNLVNGDWAEVYLTINGAGPLSGNRSEQEALYAYASAITIFDGKDGDILEAFIEGPVTSENALDRSLRNSDQTELRKFRDAFSKYGS